MPADEYRPRLWCDRLAETVDDERSLPPAAVGALHGAFAALVAVGLATMCEPGAGTGRIAIPALAAGFEVAALDISAPMLATLRHRLDTRPELVGRCEIVVGDATSLPFGDDRFDVGVLAQVLYLIPAWQLALDELIRVVRPGGRVLLVQARTHMSPALAAWDAAWREAVESVGHRPIPQEPDDATAAAALSERTIALTESALASWTFGQTVAEALDGLDRMRPLFDTLSDDVWATAVSSFRRWQRGSGLSLDVPLDGTVTLTVVSGIVPPRR